MIKSGELKKKVTYLHLINYTTWNPMLHSMEIIKNIILKLLNYKGIVVR